MTAQDVILYGSLADRPEPSFYGRLYSVDGVVYLDTGTAWQVWTGQATSDEIRTDASQIEYDPTDTGMSAVNVQAAIDELFAEIPVEATLQNLGVIFNQRTAKTALFTVVAGDKGVLFDITSGTFTASLTAAATLGNAFTCAFFNTGAGVVTIDADGTEEIRDFDGSATTKTLAQGEGGILICDGVGFILLKFGASTPAGADVTYDNTTSGLAATDVQAAVDELAAKKVHFCWSFNPKSVCDGTIDRLFLMTVGPDFPNGLKITRWNLSFDADPTTEVDLDFKRADAFIGVANAAVVDVLDTTNGVSSETTEANINGDAAVANGKVLYLEFGTTYSTDNLQIIFEFWGYAL